MTQPNNDTQWVASVMKALWAEGRKREDLKPGMLYLRGAVRFGVPTAEIHAAVRYWDSHRDEVMATMRTERP